MSAPFYLPAICSVALHKSELAYCIGISQYKLKQLIKENENALQRIGYRKFDKVLYPHAVSIILGKSGLRIDESRLAECIGKQYSRIK